MHHIEIVFNLWLQSLGDWLKMPMLFFSFLGTQNAYMLLVSIMYWSIDNRLGIRLGILLLVSNSFNTGLKWLFRYPRPYWVDARIQALSMESSFGLPSGHAMTSISIWGKVILWFRKHWINIILSVIIFSIGISRLYLGVHFLSDVLTGWIFGLILLLILDKIDKPFLAWLNNINLAGKFIFFFITSLLIIVIFKIIFISLSDWIVPQNWILISRVTAPGSSINPFKQKEIFMIAGSWFGMLTGAYWIKEIGGFNIERSISNKALRLFIGFFGLMILAFGLTKLALEGDDWIIYSLIYFQYALIGFWVTGFAPFIFIKIRLATNYVE